MAGLDEFGFPLTGSMKSEDLAREVEAIIRECTTRVTGVGHDQYAREEGQLFELQSLDWLFESAEEEMRDLVVYACMLRIRIRRLRDHFTKLAEESVASR